MPQRRYSSPVRDAAAAQTRTRLLDAAGELLRDEHGFGTISLEAVANAAGVSRLTVYNQFGSRRALLEEVFDERARQGGLHRIAAAMALPDAAEALQKIAGIFCDFWSSDVALGRLHHAATTDPELSAAIKARNELRRGLLKKLVHRALPTHAASASRMDELVDLLFALSSHAMHEQLSVRGRKPAAVKRMLKSAFASALAQVRER